MSFNIQDGELSRALKMVSRHIGTGTELCSGASFAKQDKRVGAAPEQAGIKTNLVRHF